MSKNWIKESLSFKLGIVSILVLLLLIPMNMIKNLTRERENTHNGVMDEISSIWADKQTINGPIITIPYKVAFKEEDKVKWSVAYAHFLPEQLNASGKISPQIRYRGIHKSVVYTADLKISGYFNQLLFDQWDIDPELILWENAYLSFGVSDMRGISQTIQLNVNNKKYTVEPGIRSNDVMQKGISSFITILPETQKYNFSFDLSLRGSKSLNFTPLGKETNININSPWESPSYNGAFLPNNYTTNEDGFDANWQVLHLNRNFPQSWIGKKYRVDEAEFGVDFLMPVNQYQKSERAAKYAIMFIGLTFIVFFFIEVLSGKQIHPIQYLLVGFGIVIFYTLLLALSEHISFNWAYLIASSAVIILITLYAKSVFKQLKTTLSILGLLSTLYTFLFTILQLEAYSLLMGSIGLFIALSLIMLLSRKIDWNNPIKMERKENI